MTDEKPRRDFNHAVRSTVSKRKELTEIKKQHPKVAEKTLRIKLEITKPVTKRAKRIAKKLFKKCKQAPSGWFLRYKMESVVDCPPMPTEKLKQEWAYLDARAEEMFHKKYDNLDTRQQHKLIDTLHKDDLHT